MELLNQQSRFVAAATDLSPALVELVFSSGRLDAEVERRRRSGVDVVEGRLREQQVRLRIPVWMRARARERERGRAEKRRKAETEQRGGDWSGEEGQHTSWWEGARARARAEARARA
eukprot:6174387-Pleurochrysis_carterae.AAC.2